MTAYFAILDDAVVKAVSKGVTLMWAEGTTDTPTGTTQPSPETEDFAISASLSAFALTALSLGLFN